MDYINSQSFRVYELNHIKLENYEEILLHLGSVTYELCVFAQNIYPP